MLRIPSPGRRLLLAPAAILAISVLFGTFGNFRGESTGNSQPEEVELITLRPAAFEPAEITRPQGPFVLFIDDRSGREDSSLVLQRATSERLRAINMDRRKQIGMLSLTSLQVLMFCRMRAILSCAAR